jgi:hypothetical protein
MMKAQQKRADFLKTIAEIAAVGTVLSLSLSLSL